MLLNVLTAVYILSVSPLLSQSCCNRAQRQPGHYSRGRSILFGKKKAWTIF